ncbi:MAG: DNA topoisomerase 3 [Acidiferrobacter sp.]
MRLVIAEKPSLGKAIAAQLPGQKKPCRTHIVCGNDVVTWAFGHLYELAEPDHYLSDSVPVGSGKKRWRLEDLPIIPLEWKKIPKVSAKPQLAAIKLLLKDAGEVVNAGDPDREGQLLIDEILEALKWKGVTRRIWLAALDPASVQKALTSLKDNVAYRPLRDAAEARGRADWLVGMNLTRCYTLKSNNAGVVSVGRVQTPTLALVVRRDIEIEAFVPTQFYVPTTQFHHANGEYKAVWKAPADFVGIDAEGRLTSLPTAQDIIKAVAGKQGQVLSFESQDGQEGPPLPFTLSKLQAAASAKHGLSAQDILNAAQALYETHKLTSYPRTDCPYLPESQHSDARLILAAITRVNPALAGVVQKADLSLKSGAWNDNKITAHHGIIPTPHDQVSISALSDAEQKIYDLIVRAYVCQFYPRHAFTKTTTVTDAGGHKWEAKGRVVKTPGWRSVMQPDTTKDEDEADAQTLPLMRVGDSVDWVDGRVDHRVTKPPARFTDGTLIAAMSGVHKYVTDPKIKARLKETSGLGTEATRANILETLLKREFITRQGKQLISTERGRLLVAALPEVLTDPGVTGLWEDALSEVASGTRTRQDFEDRQKAFVTKPVEAAKAGAALALPAVAKPTTAKSKAGAKKTYKRRTQK